ncbi:hypothetical protein [Clostridium sp. YIM B02551]|uniref:hypothetical protein n=1 Tax=Clostridium sp. YIM B02551 TaxID=2910679 RepID=UPI001EEB53A8|nr:hypothetical protein [Clostridium sp. YIM B02551]
MKDMNETKQDKFVRIAEARTNKIIDMVKLLGNCSNRNIYEYEKDEVKKIFSAIEEELRIAKAKFEMADSSEKKFKLR